MILLNVSFGIYVAHPLGWIFMILIILIECLALSYLLTSKWTDKKIYIAVFVSNTVSGILGIIGSIILTGGWWLVVWFPWVSDNEVEGNEGLKALAIFYMVAFVLTILIEWAVNLLILQKSFRAESVVTNTILINLLSYLVGSIALYSYSF